jgi:hypothetical protein
MSSNMLLGSMNTMLERDTLANYQLGQSYWMSSFFKDFWPIKFDSSKQNLIYYKTTNKSSCITFEIASRTLLMWLVSVRYIIYMSNMFRTNIRNWLILQSIAYTCLKIYTLFFSFFRGASEIKMWRFWKIILLTTFMKCW